MQSKTGEIYDGKVTGITNFGAFIKLSNGESGMVHISEVASTYVKDIKDHLTEGQDVKVKVLAVNENNKISLSIKQAVDTPKERNDKSDGKFNRGNQGRDAGRKSTAPAYRSAASSSSAPLTFEEMMAKFKQDSDEKMSALKKTTDFKGNNRRNKNWGLCPLFL